MTNEPNSLTEKAMQALSNAVAKVIAERHRHGGPVAVWRDGKAVWISPNEALAVREEKDSWGGTSNPKP